jgi:hypothetical protein
MEKDERDRMGKRWMMQKRESMMMTIEEMVACRGRRGGRKKRGTSGGVGWQAGNIFGLGENLPQVGEGMNG